MRMRRRQHYIVIGEVPDVSIVLCLEHCQVHALSQDMMQPFN